jgi:hypothetical protein
MILHIYAIAGNDSVIAVQKAGSAGTHDLRHAPVAHGGRTVVDGRKPKSVIYVTNSTGRAASAHRAHR